MTKQEDNRRKSRRDLLLILLLLPFGVLFMFIFGQAAIRLAPTWMLPANMFSMLDPDAGFAGLDNPLFIQPLNPAILTPFTWEKNFLTPGSQALASNNGTDEPPAPDRTPKPPPVANTPDDNQPPPPVATATPISGIVLPTISPPQRANLVIYKTDNSNTYTPGTSINYTIIVSNGGEDDAPRFNIIDNIPAVISGLTVNCTPASNCGTNTSSGNTVSFTAASLPPDPGNQLVITVSGFVVSGATGNLSNFAEIIIPKGAGFRDDNLGNNSVTDTDTQLSIYDVAITKSDSLTTYTATDTQFNYSVEVTNSGPSDAIGITINDPIPSGIASWTWACTTVNSASGCDGATGSANFTDTVTIRSGGNIIYSVTANLETLTPPQNPQDISNTANLTIPGGPGVIQEQNPANNTATDTNTPAIDLSIQKTSLDAPATYTAGGTVTYQITATNNSTFNLSGIAISDPKPTAISAWDWTCLSPTNLTCTSSTGLTSNFTDSIDLLAGESIQYDVTATIIGNPGDNIVGNLVNTATISVPTGLVDSNPGDNSSAFTHTSTAPAELNIGSPDSIPYNIPEGAIATFFLSQPIVSNGNGAADFVFYENPMSPGIHLDHIIIEVSSDGSAWSQVFYWGDGIADTNTNVDINLPNIASACTPNSTEEDNCPIASGDLYNNTGITIDLDSLGLSGSYSWIRFTAPAGSGDAAQVDAIQILP